MSDEPLPRSEIILYQTEDGQTRVQCRFENETVWLSQKLLAELFGKDVRTINEHIQNIFEEGELAADSVVRKFRITAADGKSYETQHYNLDVIISVGYRVKSHRGTQFRIWATQRLREYVASPAYAAQARDAVEMIIPRENRKLVLDGQGSDPCVILRDGPAFLVKLLADFSVRLDGHRIH